MKTLKELVRENIWKLKPYSCARDEFKGEAKAYLKDAVLGAHTIELCEALLALKTNDAVEVFDWPDDMKLKSCMTLFEIADPEQELFGAVLDKFFDGERDENTIKLLNK